MADAVGFEIEKLEYDSVDYQFTMSEEYSRRGKSVSNDFEVSVKTKKMFQKQTELLNILHDSD